MATAFANALPVPAFGTARADRRRFTRHSGPCGAITSPTLLAGDPVVATGAPDSMMAIVRTRTRPSRYRVVDALVTIAIIAWLAAALASMIVEFRGVPSETVAKPAAPRDLPAALTGMPTWRGNSAHRGWSLI